MKKKIWIIVIVVAVLAFMAYQYLTYDEYAGYEDYDMALYEEAINSEDYVAVAVEQVTKRDFSKSSEYTGESKPQKTVLVTSETNGRLTKKHVKVGDRVSKGDVLFEIDSESISREVDNLTLALQTAKANYDVQLADYKKKKKAYENGLALFKSGSISKQDLEDLKLQAADDQLVLVESQYQQAKHNLSQAKKDLKKVKILAPMSGLISTLMVDELNMIQSGAELANIVDMSQVKVSLYVTENMINKLSSKSEIQVMIKAISKDKLSGQVDSISPVADPESKLYLVSVLIDNADMTIKPGMFAKVIIPLESSKQAISVKAGSVLKDGDDDIVYVFKDDQAIKKVITLGFSDEAYVEVKEGLTADDMIIVKGQNYVKEGSPVKVIEGE